MLHQRSALYDNRMMISEFNKSHERASEFFASKNFRDFKHELSTLELPGRSPPFVELSFKCCGYGYFPAYKDRMVRNFMEYLTDAVRECAELSTLKIIFNGFDVNDGSIERIYQAVLPAITGKKLRTLWLHTNNLRKCRIEDLVQMFTIFDKAGVEITCEQISIQMSDWEFEKGYPSYTELANIFNQFYSEIMDSLKFKKFRLEISSWYMKEKEAYNFLKDTLNNEAITKNFEAFRQDAANNRNSQIDMEARERTNAALQFFLQNMDRKYLTPKYPFKKSHQRYDQNEKREHEQMLSRMDECEEQISKKLVKYPNEYIMQLKVEQFHKQMTTFLGGLLYKLPYIQEYHIDLRNWHPMFGMGNLKKQLDTKVNSKQEFSLIRRSLGLASKAVGKPMEGEEVGLKTIYTM